MDDTLALTGGGNLKQRLLRTGATLAVILVVGFIVSYQYAISLLASLSIAAILGVGAFFLVLAVYFIGMPHRLDDELTERNQNLERELEERSASREDVQKLEAAYDRGGALRDGGNLTREIVELWCSETTSLLDEFFLGEVFLFRTYDDNAGRLAITRIIPRRLKKLRIIIGRQSNIATA